RVGRRRRRADARRQRALLALVPEGPVRVRTVVVTVATALAVLTGAGGAGAANECTGLQTSLPITGPWVVIPAPARGAASTAVWEMRCPRRGYIVAGIAADVPDRTSDGPTR